MKKTYSKRALLTLACLSSIMTIQGSLAGTFEEDCLSLANLNMSVPADADASSTWMIDTEVRDAGTETAYCVARFGIDIDSNQPSEMRVIYFLPENWSGRFMQSGGGNLNPGYSENPDMTLIEEGFAQARFDNDSNLDNTTFPDNISWADYNVNDEADRAFSKDGIHLSTVVGRQILESFYGQKADYSYYQGCSTGGNMGIQAAMNHPETFDGISAGAPANYWSPFYQHNEQFQDQRAALLQGSQMLNPFTNGVREAVLTVCDGMDGQVDGIIDWPDMCNPNPDEIAKIGEIAGLSDQDIELLKDWYVARPNLLNESGEGPEYYTPTVSRITTTFPGSAWFLTVFENYYWGIQDPDFPKSEYGLPSTFTAIDSFDFSNPEYLRQMSRFASSYYYSHYDKSIREFGDAGGKLILWHNYDDNFVFIDGTIDWFNAMKKMDGRGAGAVKKYAQFFRSTTNGGSFAAHCGADDKVLRDALVNWVENKNPPKGHLLLDSHLDSSRPACEEPNFPVKQKGNSEEKWQCLPPNALK